jgi:hypothetical protein
MQNFFNEHCPVLPAIFLQVAKTNSASFETDVLLILPDGAGGRFSDSNHTPYSFLK